MRYGHLCGFLEAKMVNSGIAYLNVNAGQNKFEVKILKNAAKMV